MVNFALSNECAVILKRNKYHIINAWILLFCFAIGQYIVYAHQHKLVKTSTTSYSINKAHPQQTVTEKCRLCDAMHHSHMVLNTGAMFHVLVVADHTYKGVDYNFTSIAPIHASGRAPPFLDSSC
ncbi:hypothetical protein BH09BAC6_BH09BAC6_07280 [soil metagenome]